MAKYDGYINKERELAEKLTRLDGVPLDLGIDYSRLTSLSFEARQKLDQVRPSHTRTSLPDQRSFPVRPRRSIGILGAMNHPIVPRGTRQARNTSIRARSAVEAALKKVGALLGPHRVQGQL